MNGVQAGPGAFATTQSVSMVGAATQICFRQQERIIALTSELRSIADQTLGSIPSAGTNQVQPKPSPVARLHELNMAQTSIDDALDQLAAQIERYRSL